MIRSVDAREYGRVLGLVWENRFEVHADQIIGLAVRVEPISIEHAAG